MTTKLTDKNISNVANLGIQWQTVITADGSTATTAVAGRGYLIDTTSNAHTINLPASAIAGDTIAIKDYAGTFGTNNLTIGRNGSNIQGAANDSLISSARASVELIYVDATKGWVYTNESNVADLQNKEYLAATGGTVTTSGDYKIHTFTGDGCFVVSAVGNPAGSDSVDYLVVAGGGGSGQSDHGGGGGAGGYRESSGAASGCYTVSPLGACVSALPVSATTYPITVGAGGGGASGYPGTAATSGSNSVFSTITSTGGGAGGSIPDGNGQSGGSGGGGYLGSAGSAGNTPPVSPPQGNPGGGPSPGASPNYGASGGGGATTAGSPGTPTAGGAGGAGATSSINGTPTGRAGGGGGSSYGGGTGGSASDGGGAGGASGDGTPGTANTGGGAGGSGGPPTGGYAGRSGGKGIVIIRYKYQN